MLSAPVSVSLTGASDHVKVYVRVRPPNERELASEGYTGSSQGSQSIPTVSVIQPNHVVIGSGSRTDTFTYDCVGGEFTTQEQVFNDVGKSIVEQCVKGYNGTIFAYGQTGSGKTYTMQGPSKMSNVVNHKDRGIIPRCLEYLFQLIEREEQMVSSVKYLCKASYIEIYNEMIYDLLDNSTTARATREDIKRGVYVDGVTEESIHSPEDAYKLFEQGSANRHISATSMNRESSRSHTVLMLTIQSMALIDGINHIRESRFNLVDLAGSERQKLANTEGLRLKEAGNINKSLLCLGSVINALGEIAIGHSRHVHYRDSRLTFLLKDSLGGNSNTFIVANVSPSALCYQESLSTLRFAQRAKMIRNKAVVNEDIQGNVNELRAEIQRLKSELAGRRTANGAEPATVTEKLLFETLAKLRLEQEEHLAMTQKGFMLDDACKAREKQIQSAQLIIKFKESALASYRKGATNTALEAEKSALQEEINQLRKQLDFHPEALKVKAENLSLREMLQKYEKYQAGLEELEEQQKRDKEFLHDLAGKLVELEKENETLRSKLGSATPRNNMDLEDIDFSKIEGIDDIMQESPPKVRDSDRRFSSDIKSLLQRVTKSRQAEYRRLSGNFGNTNSSSAEGAGQGARCSTGMSTPVRKDQRPSLNAEDSSAGINLSESIFAHTNMHSDDSVEMTLLKRDVDRLKDENSVLMEEKLTLEKDFSDAQFQLMAMEKYLEQATNQAEQLGSELQSSRHALSTLEQDAGQKIMDLNREMQEQVELMKEMRQASVQLEEEMERLRENHREIEQQLKLTVKDLDESRQRLIENQKEYDHQVEINMRRINEFQDKETRWETAKAELQKTKEMLENQLEQEKSRMTNSRSELEKEHRKLLDDCEQLNLQKNRLQGAYASLEKELEALRESNVKATEEYHSKLQQQVSQHDTALKAEKTQKSALESELRTVQDNLAKLKLRFEEVNKLLETKLNEAGQTLQEREKQLEDQVKALELKKAQELEECESKLRLEREGALNTLRETLVEAHMKELQKLESEAMEQARLLEEAKSSLAESIANAEKALISKKEVDEELAAIKEKYDALGLDAEKLKLDKSRLKSQMESLASKCKTLETTLDEQKQELTKLTIKLQQERLEKDRLEITRNELREKVSEMARKIGESEQKLAQARDETRNVEIEYRTVQDELEHQLSKARNELVVKTSENQLNEEYKRKFRELRAQFADLGPTVTERQQQGFHERELKRTMEMEKMREEINQAQTRSTQLEANLALAQEMNEQLHEDAKASTAKIAEEMEKRLKDVEIQRQSAEREVEQALETVQQKTAQLQALEEQVIIQKDKILMLEEELKEEHARVERLEETLNGGKALQEEKEANEKELLVQETRQKLKEEQLMAQRQLLIKMREEQQALIKQQLERRDKTRALFEGLATENGKLMEQVRDLGLVNENMMRHQNPKQKLQYHVKIKQENNELRIENQRLMFKAIELEERLGNKENVESLRKQVHEMHGVTPYQSTLETSIGSDGMGMEMVKGLHDDMPIHRSPSRSPTLSSETGSTALSARGSDDLKENKKHMQQTRIKSQPPSAIFGQKRKAAMNDHSSGINLNISRKRPVVPPPPQRSVSSTSSTASGSSVETSIEMPMGPRARAKAAADAALAAAKQGRKQIMSSSRQPTPIRQTTPTNATSASTSRSAGPKPVSRVTTSSTTTSASRTSGKDDLLRGARSGGAVMKPTLGTKSSNPPIIGSASAQRALVREARLAKAALAPAFPSTKPATASQAAVNNKKTGIQQSPSPPPLPFQSKTQGQPQIGSSSPQMSPIPTQEESASSKSPSSPLQLSPPSTATADTAPA